MFPRRSTLACLTLAGLAACSTDRPVGPTAEFVDGVAGAITTASTITAEYDLNVGQTVRIVPRSTTRTNRLRWVTSNSRVASVNSNGVVSALAAGTSTVTVSGSGVLESYAVVVAAPAPTLTGFSLQPAASVTLNAGQTQQFTASQTWSDGLTRTSGVTFTATGGTISSSGLFTAGNLAGTFMVIASCSCGATAIADTTPVVVNSVAQLTRLTISPKTVSLNAGATQQFGVTANWSTGATDVPPVVWSATGGTVSSSGAYVAPTTAGTYRVIVAHSGGSIRDTAVVTVSGTAQLTKLSISPKMVTLNAGASQQFSVSATWSTGATDVPPVTWSATGGTISRDGAYVTPSTPGVYQVIVAHDGGTRRDTATVSVTSVVDRPTGSDTAVVLFRDGFENGVFAGTQGGIRWSSLVRTDVTNSVSRFGGGSARLRQGENTSWTEMRFAGLPKLKEVFLQFWLYQPSGLELPALGIAVPVPGEKNDKFFRLWGGAYDGANDIKYGASNRSGNLFIEYKRNNLDGTLQNMGPGGAVISPDVAQSFFFIGNPTYLGRWSRVRIRASAADFGVDNGVLQIWIDDRLVIDRQRLRSYAGTGGTNVFESGYLSGWANNGFPIGQYQYIDEFTISRGGFPR